MRNKLLVACFVGSLALDSALAVELVTNGGFETGDLTGFSDSSEPEFAFVSTTAAHTGNYGYLNGNVGQDGTLTQRVATQLGMTYRYSFYLESDGATPNDVIVKLGNTVLLTQTNTGAFAYRNFSGTIIADGNNDALTFAFRNDNGFFGLDDVSLTSNAGPLPGVPEPASWALLATGFGLTGVAARRRVRVVSC